MPGTHVAPSIAHEEPSAPLAEQAALIRVAGLLLGGAGEAAVFAAVARELAVLTGAARVDLTRYEPDGSAPAVGTWAASRRVRAARAGGRRQRVVVRDGSRARAWSAVVLVTADVAREVDVAAVVAGFLELVAPALASAQARQALDDARERSVRAADRARAEIAEQLRTGPRRRLRRVAEQLTAAQTALPEDRERALALIGTARTALTAGMEELQHLARGIHPMLLSERGLDLAMAQLADACPVRVALHGRVGRRLSEATELAAYYVVDSGLRRSAGRSRVSGIEISIRLDAGLLAIDVADDAPEGGGAPAPDLVEVRDRVTALGGDLTVGRSHLGGTALRARIPALGVDG